MPDNLDNLILEPLRAIRTDVGSVHEDLKKAKGRLRNLEITAAALRRKLADLYSEVITQHARCD